MLSRSSIKCGFEFQSGGKVNHKKVLYSNLNRVLSTGSVLLTGLIVPQPYQSIIWWMQEYRSANFDSLRQSVKSVLGDGRVTGNVELILLPGSLVAGISETISGRIHISRERTSCHCQLVEYNIQNSWPQTPKHCIPYFPIL